VSELSRVSRYPYLEGRITRVDGTRASIEIPGSVGGDVEVDLQDESTVPGPVVIGIRPECFNVRQATGPKLQVDVEFVERLGGESFLHAPTHPAGSLIMRQGDEDERPKGTGRHEIGVNWRKAHLFAPDGTAIAARRGP